MRSASAARLVIGGACLWSPHRLLALAGGPDRDDPTTLVIARVLGGRLVVQAAADLALGRRTRGADIVIDLTHAASMVAVALRWPEHRRSAWTSAVFATTVAMLDAAGPARRVTTWSCSPRRAGYGSGGGTAEEVS